MRGELVTRLHGTEDTVYGLVVKMPTPAILEVAGHTGFDFAVIDTEHGMAHGGELEHHLRAADSAGLECLVRVGNHDASEVLRALDAGASGVVVPHVTNPDEAAAAVRAAHYPPIGTRGLAVSTRAGRQGTVSLAEHVEAALRSTVVVVQIEDGSALQHINEIASTTRLDAILIGPTDLSISLGHPGEFEHPRVVAAIDECVDRIIAAQNAAICVLVSSLKEADDWRRRGARVILVNATSLLAECLGDFIDGVHASAPRATIAR